VIDHPDSAIEEAHEMTASTHQRRRSPPCIRVYAYVWSQRPAHLVTSPLSFINICPSCCRTAMRNWYIDLGSSASSPIGPQSSVLSPQSSVFGLVRYVPSIETTTRTGTCPPSSERTLETRTRTRTRGELGLGLALTSTRRWRLYAQRANTEFSPVHQTHP
jgi:hypothetical protein